MRVGMVCDFFPRGGTEALLGGAEWSIANLADLLAPEVERLTVFVTCDPRGAAEVETSATVTEDRVRVMRLRSPIGAFSGRGTPRPWALSHPVAALATASRLARAAKGEKLDLLHAQTHYSLPAAVLAARWLGVPVAATLRDLRTLCEPAVCLHRHTSVPADCGYLKLLRQCSGEFFDLKGTGGSARRLRERAELSWLWAGNRLRWWCLRRCDAVIAVSEALLEIYRGRGLLDARRSLLLSVPTAPPAPIRGAAARRAVARQRLGMQEAPLLVYLGKHSAGKGTGLLRQAWGMIGSRFPGSKLVLAGEGHPPADRPGLVVVGRLPHQEALELILASDLVVSASVTAEALSRSLVEAAALGRPLLGTRTGGTPEIIHDGINGVLVERGSAPALADGLGRALANLSLLAAGAEKRQGVPGARLSAAAVRQAHLDLYQNLLLRRRGAEAGTGPGIAPGPVP